MASLFFMSIDKDGIGEAVIALARTYPPIYPICDFCSSGDTIPNYCEFGSSGDTILVSSGDTIPNYWMFLPAGRVSGDEGYDRQVPLVSRRSLPLLSGVP
jgi:hypothetical protein